MSLTRPKFFVDTNVLVYARDASESEKQPQAADWMNYLWRSQAGRLSTQVLNEYYVTVTRKLSPGTAVEDARRDIRNLVAWQPVRLWEHPRGSVLLGPLTIVSSDQRVDLQSRCFRRMFARYQCARIN